MHLALVSHTSGIWILSTSTKDMVAMCTRAGTGTGVEHSLHTSQWLQPSALWLENGQVEYHRDGSEPPLL